MLFFQEPEECPMVIPLKSVSSGMRFILFVRPFFVEPSRSPGPLQASLNPHAVSSRQSKGAPRFDGSFRELHGSIYYKSFHSPSPGVIYDTLSHFDFESKRSGVTAAILGDLSVRKNRSKSREGKNKDDHETDVSDFTSHHRME